MWVRFIRPVCALAMICMIAAIFAACGRQNQDQRVSAPVKQETLRKIEQLNAASDSAYRHMLADNMTGVRSALDHIASLIPQIEFDGVTTIEGLGALTNAVNETRRLFNAIQLDSEKASMSLIKVRLATDALTHKNAPLWHDYYEPLTGDLEMIGEGVANGMRRDVDAAFAKLEMHVGLIKPALLVSKPPEQMERIQSLLQYIKAQIRMQPYDKAQIDRGLKVLRETFDKIFDKGNQSAFLPFIEPETPVFWTLGIGAAIMSALAYTAWRMYRGRDDIVPAHRKGER